MGLPYLRAILLTAWMAASGLSQTQPPASPAPAPANNNAKEMETKEAPAIFKTGVNLVMVPVVVRDSKGKAIGTLTKENFQLFDRGKPQEITRFAVEKSGDEVAKAAKTSDASPIEGEPPAPPDIPERFIAYLFDDMHLDTGDLIRARDAARHQLAKLAKTDRAALYTTSGQNQVDFTDDIDKLQSTLLLLRTRSISNMGSTTQCPDMSYYMADRIINMNDSQAISAAVQEVIVCAGLQPNQQSIAASLVQAAAQQVLAPGRQETQVSFAVLKDVVRRMSAMPGQRIVVLVSPGFISPVDLLQDQSDILDRAIKAKVILNGLDARGLWVDPMVDASRPGGASTTQYLMLKQQYDRDAALAQEDVLATLSYGTGGEFFHNNNDLESGLGQLTAAPEFYYVLGFSPQNLKLDGAFHGLKVTVKLNPPVSLNTTARKGYYAPRKLSSAEETAKQEIEDALFSRDELSDLPVELHTQYFKGDKDATIAVLCRMDTRRLQFRKADGRNNNVFTIVSALFDRNGNFVSGLQKTVSLKLKDETLAKLSSIGEISFKSNFSVQPGTYMVRLVVRDSEGQLMSALNGAVAIQ